jgi:hypothetical protein
VALRSDPEFAEVLEEDKEALNIFRKAGDLGAFVEEDDQHSAGSFENQTQSEAPERRARPSRGSSVSSKRSKASAQSSLPPVYEEDGSDEDSEGDHSPPKRLNAADADQLSVSTAGHTGTHETIVEGSAEGSDSE